MLISIIIPLYNKELSISSTISSVLNQTYENLEIIIIDDGSTDESINIISKIQDDRIYLTKQKNFGVAYTRNEGVKKATGDFLLFLDADDYLYPRAIEALVITAKKFSYSDVISGNYAIDDGLVLRNKCFIVNETIIQDPFKLLWFYKWNLRMGSFIIKREIANKLEKFRSDIIIGEDIIFIDNLLKYCKIVYTPFLILKYNRQYSLLSKRKVLVENVYEWVLPINDNEFYPYLYQIYLEKLFRKIISSFIRFDSIVALKLIFKYYKVLPKSFIYFMQRLNISSFRIW